MPGRQNQFPYQRAAQFPGGLTVNSHHLLPPCMRHPRQDASLGHGRVTLVALDAGERDVLLLKLLQEQFASLVFAKHAHRQHVHAEFRQIVDGVGPATGYHYTFPVLQN